MKEEIKNIMHMMIELLSFFNMLSFDMKKLSNKALKMKKTHK